MQIPAPMHYGFGIEFVGSTRPGLASGFRRWGFWLEVAFIEKYHLLTNFVYMLSWRQSRTPIHDSEHGFSASIVMEITLSDATT